MKKHKFATSNPPEIPVFDHLKSGAKTVEGRPYSSKYQKVEAGDSIVFASGSKKHEATVKSVKKYRTLKGYLQGEGLKKTLPGVSSMKDATRIYNKWSSPAKRSQLRQKYGHSMLAIRV